VPALSRTLFGERLAPREPAREHYGMNIALMAVCAAASIAVISIAWSRPLARLKWRPISQPIIDGIRACPGPLYNRFDDGGYVIWFAQEVPVFVDNRQDPYALDFLQEHLQREQSGDFEPVFARYNITCAFLPPGSPTAQRAIQSGWRVTANDGEWLVLQAPKP
jgi:hypothetical protein